MRAFHEGVRGRVGVVGVAGVVAAGFGGVVESWRAPRLGAGRGETCQGKGGGGGAYSIFPWPSRLIIDHVSLSRRNGGGGGVLISCLAVVSRPQTLASL